MVKMKLASVLMIGIAILIAFAVSSLVFFRLQKAPKTEKKAFAIQSIAVAKFDLSGGTLIDKEKIKMVLFLKESLPPGSFKNESELLGRVLIRPVKMDEPILATGVAPINVKEGGVAAVVNLQKRAISVKTDRVIGVSGFILPGHRVDVLATVYYKEIGKESVPVTKTILENILVLAVGSALEEKGKKEKVLGADVITLEVTPEEGEKLTLASIQGKIQLVLRNYVDNEDVFTKGVTIPNLLSSYKTMEKLVRIEKTDKTEKTEKTLIEPLPTNVTVIRGTAVTEITF